MKLINQLGKVDKSFLEKIVLSNLGATRQEIIRPPRYGVDVGSISIHKDKILVFSTDPLSIIPALGFNESGWLSAHTLANDLATSGISPAYASLNFNLPPKIKDNDFKIYLESLSAEFKDLGVSVISGHTGRYDGCDYSIVGAGTMIGIGNKDQYIDSSMARNGDSIIITKGIAIEATAILAKVFPNTIKDKYGKSFLIKAQKTFSLCSSVKDALLASSIGVGDNGVTAMHDAAEGGIYGGLIELASASSKGLIIDKSVIPISEESKLICSLFNLDPFTSLSSGTIIITVRPEKELDVIDVLRSANIFAKRIGKIIPSENGLKYVEGKVKKLLITMQKDKYWKIYQRALKKGWN
jgi:hydrogenase maturation factor